MNINGFARNYMARYLSGEEYLMHVATLIERQLKEWNQNYELFVLKLYNYEVIINNQDDYYYVQLSESELHSLQKSGSYEVDRKVWGELLIQGLPIIKGKGNYIEMVLYNF